MVRAREPGDASANDHGIRRIAITRSNVRRWLCRETTAAMGVYCSIGTSQEQRQCHRALLR